MRYILTLIHIPVRREDLGLQIFKIGDKFFCDKNLSFGGTTSPPLYDDPAELFVSLAVWEAKTERRCSVRQLDDEVATGTYDQVTRTYEMFRDLCQDIGVRLASTEDPDKAFPPSQGGTVLGIDYHLPSWSYKLAPAKADKLLILLFDIIQKDKMENGRVRTLLGKMAHYAHLFDCVYERAFIQKCHEEDSPKIKMIQITKHARSQAGHWIRSIHRASVRNTIPFYKRISFPGQYIIHGDASGGLRGGYGAVMELDGQVFWTAGRWSQGLSAADRHKLTMLEAYASLSGLLLAPDRLRNKHVQVNIDVFI